MAAPLPQPAIAALQRALALLKAGDGVGAAMALGTLPLAARGHPDALTVAAMVQKAQGNREKARGLFEAATRAAPNHPGIWNSYANLLDELGEHDTAIAAYRRSVALEPRAASVWTNLALAAIAAEQWGIAAEALDRALALAPADTRALAARGLVHAGRGALDAAVAAHRRALVATPGDALVRHNLAVALRRLGRAEEAIEALGAATRPDSAALRGHLLADLGQFDAALAQYRAVLAAEPAHLVTLEAMAELLPQLDRAAEGLDGYRAALARPAPPALWRAAIAAAKGHGDAETQLGWARAAQAAHGAQLDWQLAEAGALSQLGRAGEALALAEAAAAAHPKASGAQNYLAWLLLKGGDPARAERHALRATELAPLDQSPWGLLTLIWRLTGDDREAWLADYDRLVIASEIETPRGWPSLAAFLGDLAVTLGRLHQTLRPPADQSLRGGTQTRGKLFETSDPVLLALRGALLATVERSLGGLAADPAHPFLGRLARGAEMAGSWSVRLRGQGFHISHIHPQGWLSSAFYVEVPPEIGDFDDPGKQPGGGNAGKLLFGVPGASLGLDLPPRRIVTPVPGRLAIFPSYVWHGTAPFDSAAARLTVAFDALPKA